MVYDAVILNPESIKTLRELEQAVGRRIPRIEQFKRNSLGYKVMKRKIFLYYLNYLTDFTEEFSIMM